MSMNMTEHLGKVAYEAYCETRQWKSFNGDPLPRWDNVRPDIKEGWQVAARAILITMRDYIADFQRDLFEKEQAREPSVPNTTAAP